MKLATICYIDDGERVLMLHRNKHVDDVHYGKWIAVGGKFEVGESPEDCAKREIFEETGLIAETLQLRGVITFPSFTPEDDWITFIYWVTAFSGEVKPCDEGDLTWVPYEQLHTLPTWEGDALFHQWLLEKRPFFSAKMTYAQEKLVAHEVNFYQMEEQDGTV